MLLGPALAGGAPFGRDSRDTPGRSSTTAPCRTAGAQYRFRRDPPQRLLRPGAPSHCARRATRPPIQWPSSMAVGHPNGRGPIAGSAPDSRCRTSWGASPCLSLPHSARDEFSVMARCARWRQSCGTPWRRARARDRRSSNGAGLSHVALPRSPTPGQLFGMLDTLFTDGICRPRAAGASTRSCARYRRAGRAPRRTMAISPSIDPRDCCQAPANCRAACARSCA